jgi:hypothetical protein
MRIHADAAIQFPLVKDNDQECLIGARRIARGKIIHERGVHKHNKRPLVDPDAGGGRRRGRRRRLGLDGELLLELDLVLLAAAAAAALLFVFPLAA